ncbi:MAG: 30S ribosomal protein S6 [Acidobacteriota bacterium]|nr:30S ribosomal protein S6 [Acidobacteriota bacterium]
MRNYEVVFIAAPTLTTEELDAFINHAQTVIEGKGGKIVKVDNWGRKSLAYKINKFREGYYVVLSIDAEGGAIAELERRFRVTDFIIRFISVRIDEDLKRSEKIKAARRRKAPKQSEGAPYASTVGEAEQVSSVSPEESGDEDSEK